MPWKSDPTSLLISPLALLALVYSGKRKHSKLDIVVVLIVLCGVLGLGLAGCGPTNPGGGTPIPILETPFNYNDTPTPGTVNPSTPTPGGTPVDPLDSCGENANANEIHDIIVFSGMGATINDGNTVINQMSIWTEDKYGTPISAENFIDYPGYVNGLSGKPIQAEDARGKAPCLPVIIISYSAGTESALMYARWRIDNNQQVKKVVLLGPTFFAYREDNSGDPADFGIPDGKFDDWADYVDYLLISNVDVLIIQDAGGGWKANNFEKTDGALGEFYLETSWASNVHWSPSDPSSTNNNKQIKNYVYDWIYKP